MASRTRIGKYGLVNYREHPSEKSYTLFNFMSREEAELFESELETENIWFEKDTADVKAGKTFLFAVRKRDFDKAQRANFKVSAKFKKPIISNAILRYALMILFLGLLGLAILGYVKTH